MGTGRYNVENREYNSIDLFWINVDAMADVIEKPLTIDCVVDGIIVLGLEEDGFYYELSIMTDKAVTEGDTIHGEIQGLDIYYASFKIYNQKEENPEDGVLIESCTFKPQSQ